jgi:ribosomal peptide maturation radical SAM protein 1
MSVPLHLSPRRHRRGRDALRTVLVNMPFAFATRPSLQLGLLAELGRGAGFAVDTLHANVDLAARLGPLEYGVFASGGRRLLLGDWLFSLEAYGADAPDPSGEGLVAAVAAEGSGLTLPAELGEADVALATLLRLRNDAVPAFLDELVASVDWSTYDVVGFTSTFQQTVASLALARRVRALAPHAVFVYGGANFDGAMGVELQRRNDLVDFAIMGEADVAFPRFLAHIAGEIDAEAVPGLIRTASDGTTVVNEPLVTTDLDELPVPDYHEFFDRREQLGQHGTRGLSLPVETARGCWWGAKKHCTFCGLNNSTMTFRSKSAPRAVEEILTLADRHGVLDLAAVDNIVDKSYAADVFPALVERGVDLGLFYEVKASIPVDDLVVLAQAGVRRIQPGIESLSSHVLRLMDKGERAITNVNLLRWCRALDVDAEWNILYAFPGETVDDYREQAALMHHLVHLQPPCGVGPIWMERFSPMFTQRERFPMRRLQPIPGYALVYPESHDLAEVAYFFDYEFEQALPRSAYDDVQSAATRWRDAWAGDARPALTARRTPSGVQILDERDDDRAGCYHLDGLPAAVHQAAFRSPTPVRAVADTLGVDTADVERVAAFFVERGLFMRDGNLLLALATPYRVNAATPGWPPDA